MWALGGGGADQAPYWIPLVRSRKDGIPQPYPLAVGKLELEVSAPCCSLASVAKDTEGSDFCVSSS